MGYCAPRPVGMMTQALVHSNFQCQFYKKKTSSSTTYMITSNRTILRPWHKFHKVIWYLMQWIELIWWHKISRADVTNKIFVDITKQSTSLLSGNFQSRIWIIYFDIDVYFNVLKYHLQCQLRHLQLGGEFMGKRYLIAAMTTKVSLIFIDSNY